MQPKSPVNAVAVKKEEKEAKLRAFVAARLSAEAPAGHDSTRTLLLVARSCDSPAVVAAQALNADLVRLGYSVYLVLAAQLDDRRLPTLTETFGWDVRCLNDIRYLDAHEQLVIGPATAWVGDCMRRDPAKRDAFENFAENCAATATLALTSFRRLWQAATPVVYAPRQTQAAPPHTTAECASASLAEQSAEQGDGPLVLTRQ